MESDASDAIKFCQDKKITKLMVKYKPKKGWSSNVQYCCQEHTPEEILNER